MVVLHEGQRRRFVLPISGEVPVPGLYMHALNQLSGHDSNNSQVQTIVPLAEELALSEAWGDVLPPCSAVCPPAQHSVLLADQQAAWQAWSSSHYGGY